MHLFLYLQFGLLGSQASVIISVLDIAFFTVRMYLHVLFENSSQ